LGRCAHARNPLVIVDQSSSGQVCVKTKKLALGQYGPGLSF
jgi:hypothetical protein